MTDTLNSIGLNTNSSVCTFIKAKINPLPLIPDETGLKRCLSFLESFQKAVDMKVKNDFFKEFNNENDQNSLKISGFSTIPVYIFNPFNLISSRLFENQSGSMVVLDCAEIERILGSDFGKMPISYDFSAFLNHFKPSVDVVIVFSNSSQINLTHLDDFVRLWERKSNQLPKLKFVFDDSVCFLGMEARLRDRFRVKAVNVSSVKEIFDQFVIEIVNYELPFLLHPQLMKRLVDLTETISFNSLLNQIKFLLISHFSKEAAQSHVKGFKDIFMFITDLSIKLKSLRPSTPSLSPSENFYSVVLGGILADSQAFAEIVNELKSLAPNDFVSLFASELGVLKGSKLNEFVKQMVSEMREHSSKTSSQSKIKDFQLDLITSLTNFIRSYEVSIPVDQVINDEKGNVRRAFEADPQTALQVALKFPSVYLNCKNCCSSGTISCISSSNMNQALSPLFHNKPTMLDVCLLYRISLEFPAKSINIMSWYKSFASIVSKKQSDKSLIIARFFKSLNELQLIGMVSEFGRSRRKRRFVDKFNITDSISYE